MSSLPARILLSLLLCCCGSAWAASAADPPRWPAQGAVSPDIVSLGDCFARSYDQWMDRLREKNNFLVALALRWKFPEAQYERYRRELDCRAVSYRSDGYVVHGWLVRPKGAPGGGRLPVIIFNRGGNGSYGALTFAALFSHVFPLAEQGYLVAASQYRGALAPDGATSSPDQFGGDDVHDVTRLLGITAALPGADPHPRRRQCRDLVSGLPGRRAGGGPQGGHQVVGSGVPHHHHRRAERLGQRHDLAPGRGPACSISSA